jgi:selenocysteine lyase/cysteine desulfurase
VWSVGWDGIRAHERLLGQRFLDGLPESASLYGLPTMEGRVPTFAFNLPGRSPAAIAEALGGSGFAVWHGDYYALEIMNRLGLGDEGAVRAGFVHYNTTDEVDRLLDALHAL